MKDSEKAPAQRGGDSSTLLDQDFWIDFLLPQIPEDSYEISIQDTDDLEGKARITLSLRLPHTVKWESSEDSNQETIGELKFENGQLPRLLRLKRNGNRFSLSIFDPSQSESMREEISLDREMASQVKVHQNGIRPEHMRWVVLKEGEDITYSSCLETLEVETGKRALLLGTNSHIEAPNWSRDGHSLLFNSGGNLYKMPVENASFDNKKLIPTGIEGWCNNDHGYSPDGSQIVTSINTGEPRHSIIFVIPESGGNAVQLTASGLHSYWHGWSPDGKEIAYCARRNGDYDIYTLPIEGGEEKRLTTTKGLDDGPDYSPDGQYIYFNSTRTGSMEIWRMRPDGTEQEQITQDEYQNWFPHPSPDNKHLVFISYLPDVPAGSHPPGKRVMLRMITWENGLKPVVLTHLYGGQGTINVPSWSPDSKKIAFVSYSTL